MYWLDYSAAKITGATIKAAGYTGVIRYIDAPTLLSTKHTNLDEYRSHLAAGLTVRLVHQGTTQDADSGFQGGVNRATRAKAGADMLGYDGVIYFTNDRTTVPNVAAWQSYLDGAASVLGRARVGAYGFFNALNAAVGHASAFWQAGRRSDLVAHANFWQDNNTQVAVGGIACDRNLVLSDYSPTATPTTSTFQETDDMAESLPAGANAHKTYILPKGATELYFGVSGYGDTLKIIQADFWKVTRGDIAGRDGAGGGFTNFVIQPGRPGPIAIPADAAQLDLNYDANHDIAVGFR